MSTVQFSQIVRSALKKKEFSTSEPRGAKKFFESVNCRNGYAQFVDVFAGAGGSSLGMAWAGFRPILAVDLDEHATGTYSQFFAKRYDGVRVVCDDVNNLLKREDMWRSLDVSENAILVGCPPCQGFSTSGKKDANDERNELVYSYLKIVKKLKPVATIFENVFGMRTFDDYSRAILNGLKDLGYEILFGIRDDGTLDIVDAAYYGVPQIRKRVIVVATSNKRVSKNFEPPTPFRFPKDTLKKYGYSEEEVSSFAFETVREWIGDLPPIEAGEAHESVPNHRAPALYELTLKRVASVPKDGGSLRDAPRHLWIPCHRKPQYRDKYKDVLGRLWWDKPSVTIRASFARPTTGRYVHPEQDRSLSMREGARLQTFPDEFEFPDVIKHASKLIGNAFPPRLSYVWAIALREALEGANVT